MAHPQNALLIAMGAEKPKTGGLPPSTRNRFGGASSATPEPQGLGPPSAMSGQGMGKKSAEEAGVLKEDQRCGGCKNFTKESGECAIVDGVFDPCDGCKLYEAANGAGEGAEMDIGIEGSPGGGVRPTQ